MAKTATPDPVETPEVPPSPSEVADETVKLGRKKVSAQTADRAARFEGRQRLHDAYGTTSGRSGDRATTTRGG